MYKDIHNFTPFQHTNIEFKNALINNARTQDKTKVEGVFTAVLIYANLVDYLTKDLLKNLRQMISIFTFRKFGSVLFYDGSKQKNDLPLGKLIEHLGIFEFPNKEDFLDILEKFKKLRNQIMHNLMELDPNDLANDFDKDLARINEIAEDILSKYGTITSGLITIWNAANS